MNMRKWNEQQVVDAIRERHRRGLPLTGVYNDDLPLFAAAARYYGSWYKALAAAGLLAKPKRKWTPELVITALQTRHQQGLPMNQFLQEDRGLVRATWRRFGTWSKALTVAGIPLPSRCKWTREGVLAKLRAGGPWRMPPRRDEVPAILAQAAYRFFPSWHDVLAAAGFVPLEPRPTPQKKWSKGLVLEEIRARHQQGLRLTVNTNVALTGAAKHYFGTWGNAMAAAGQKARQCRRWSNDRVLEQLRLLHQHGAFDVSTRLKDCGLVEAARIRFGSWRRALRLVGVLEPDENQRQKGCWTRQRVIEAIQDLHVRGVPLKTRNHTKLSYAARKRFGSWRAAIVAAGLVRPGDDSMQKWSEAQVIATIQSRHRRGLSLSTVWKDAVSLYVGASARFGTWRAALQAAGFVCARRQWNPQIVLDAMRERQRRQLPLTGVQRDDRFLFAAAVKYFGTWRKAVAEAGFSAERPGKWTPERVLAEIQAWHQSGVRVSSISSQNPRLTVAAIRIFGGWHDALAAAGIPVQKKHRTKRGRACHEKL